MRICADCIGRYYAGSSSFRQGTYLCDYCNQYGEVHRLHPGAKQKKRLPLKREDCLRRMFIIACVDIDCEWGPGGLFEGPIEDLVRTLTGFASKALYSGYTHIHFREEGDYDGTSYEPYGVRQETDEEMKKRFAKIRRRRERAKERRIKNAAKKV